MVQNVVQVWDVFFGVGKVVEEFVDGVMVIFSLIVLLFEVCCVGEKLEFFDRGFLFVDVFVSGGVVCVVKGDLMVSFLCFVISLNFNKSR